jgi:hypothetical protein
MGKDKPAGATTTKTNTTPGAAAGAPQGHGQPGPATAKGAGADPIGKCTAQGCKSNSKRFDFCAEHYEQFKFGLITKLGKQVSDYEKKFDHYQAHLARTQSGRKAA